MKKQIIISLVCVVSMGVSGAVYAQVAPVMAPVTPAVTPVAPAMAPLTPAAPVSAAVAKKMKLQDAVTKMENSLQVRITNLEDLATRIQSRITKMQQEGKDMSAAVVKLATAQKAITLAKTDLASLKKADVAMVASAKPATAFTNIKNKTAKNVVVRIKAAHKALVDVVVIMKGQGMMPTTVPTTVTPSTSTIQ